MSEAMTRAVWPRSPVRPAARSRRTRRDLSGTLIFLGVLFGIAVRLREYAFDRSLWLDEISLVDSIVGRGFGGLTRPLEGQQAAPVGFLWLERAAVDVFGNNEMALRIVPVTGSLVAMVVFALVARRLLPGPAAAVGVLLFASSPNLIFYSSEVKQYSTDVMATVLLVWWTLLLGARPTWRTALVWGSGAAVLVWCSQPAIPVAACCVVVIAAMTIRRWMDLMVLLPGGAILAGSVLWEYVVTLREQSHSTLLKNYWAAGYAPEPVRLGTTVRWLHADVGSVLTDPLALRSTDLALLLIGVGVVALLLRRRLLSVALLLVPVAAGVVLAVVQVYPLRQRLALYLLPLLLLLMSASLAAATAGRVRDGGRRWLSLDRVASAVAVAAVAVGLVAVNGSAVARGVTVLGRPIDVTDGRAAIRYVADHRQPGDLVLGEHEWAGSTFDYYGARYHVHEDGSFFYVRSAAPCDVTRSLRFPPGVTRVWVVFAHRASNQSLDRAAVYLSAFGQVGTIEESYQGDGESGAYLLALGVPARPPAVVVPSWSRHGCLTLLKGD